MRNINTKIALSALSAVAATLLIGAGTYAYFSDVASSTNNTFGAGTLDLQLDDTSESFANGISATFAVANMAPGLTEAQEISFHNAGTVSIAEIAMGVTSSNIDLSNPSNSDLRDVLEMRIFTGGVKNGNVCSGGTEETTAIDTAIGGIDAPLTLDEFTGNTFDSLAIPLATGVNGQVCIQVGMSTSATDIYQGDSADATFTFTAHQDTSQ